MKAGESHHIRPRPSVRNRILDALRAAERERVAPPPRKTILDYVQEKRK
ncbi:hypothetical protein [Thiobacillus sp.]